MKVLYIHHVGVYGGASKSMAEMVGAMPKGSVTPVILTQKGSVELVFGKLTDYLYTVKGIPQLDNTRASHYSGFRWLILIREVYFLFNFFGVFRRIKTEHPDIELIHFNEITHFSVLAGAAQRIFNVPILLHVRSLQRLNDNGFITRFIKRRIRKYANKVVAIDCNVKDTLWNLTDISVIHNGLRPPLKDVTKKIGGKFEIMYLGNLLFDKGVVELTQALVELKARNIDFHCNFIGARSSKESNSTKTLNQLLWMFGIRKSAEKEIARIVDENELKDLVTIIGFTDELENYFSSADVLVFASHLNAAGRPVFEAAFHRIPSILACDSPRDDTFVPNQTGLILSKPEPLEIANALEYFASNRIEAVRMGENAYKLAYQNFNIYTNAQQILDLYKKVLKIDYV